VKIQRRDWLHIRQSVSVALLLILMANLNVNTANSHPTQDAMFVPPDIASASDIPYPLEGVATGMVTLLLHIDSNAQIKNLQVVRGIPSLTSPARIAIQNWTFTTATLNGTPIPSVISMNVVFNPFNPGGLAIQRQALSPGQSKTSLGAAQFNPPQVTSGSFAIYPVASVGWGTVVLDVTVGKTSQITNIRVVRDVPSLTSAAIEAVKRWRFNVATFQHQPIAAETIVAFVFQRNLN
jgi:outer membrane biosynthesis protein TonB